MNVRSEGIWIPRSLVTLEAEGHRGASGALAVDVCPVIYPLTIYPSWIQNRVMRERNANADAIAAMLPLLPSTFHILVALADEDRHGYAIIQDVAARTDGSIRLSPGTLYRSIQRMLEDGLIVETDERPAPEDDDERRRYYRLTTLGAAAAKAEAARLMDLVRMARARGLAPRKA